MSHSDTVKIIPAGAKVIASNQHGTPVSLQWNERFFGIQYHPEVTHSHEGLQILKNFLDLSNDLLPFHIDDFKREIIEGIRAVVGDKQVVCGVSGGVDSTVLAVLLHEAGANVRAIFVDHGLMRKDEGIEVRRNFERMGVPIETVDCAERFLSALEGVDDPEKKRVIIGNLFIDVFWDSVGDAELLAQGTLYPDVIESASNAKSKASKIKTHHNRVDRILELQAQGKVLEPLAELFKDEVRELGTALGIPEDILQRHPFPGPGLAVRCPGIITEDRLHIIRECDAIFIGKLKEHGWYDKVWQAYAGLIPVKTVGVKGDERSYEWAIALRAVISEDAMTADWVELPPLLLRETSHRILNEVKGINRVLYDISTKPPASIEWE
jgi:GMP synthase (glutamine-hydrolysing)